MYSISTRINSVFFFFVVCLVILAAINILSTIFLKTPPTIKKFEISKVTHLYNHPYTRVQHAVALLDLDVDFSPCFNWNTNLVFGWISATYKTKNNETKVTVWDNIMLRRNPNSHKVVIDKKMFEYPIIDVFKSLSGKEVILELNWEHMPVIGPILKHKIDLGKFKLPEKTTAAPEYSMLAREIHYEDENSTDADYED